MRKALALITALALVVLAGPPAMADGSGFCSIPGSTVNFNVKETPSEGSVKYVSVSSAVALDTGSSSSQATRAEIFYELPDNSVRVMPPHWAYEVVVAGDGLYNYRIDFNWDGLGLPYQQVGRVLVTVEKANSQNDCHSNVYI